MKKIVRLYLAIPIMYKLFAAFFLGSVAGIVIWKIAAAQGADYAAFLVAYIAPFGDVFVNMLKMIVIPIIFFSLVLGAISLPISRFGRIGLKVVLWYLGTSLLAAVIGVAIALWINPGGAADLDWQAMAVGKEKEISQLSGQGGGDLVTVLTGMFENPFHALANGNFLPIIVFAIIFGLAASVIMDKQAKAKQSLQHLVAMIEAINAVLFKIVDWIMEYAPVGVLALSMVNFGVYGPSVVGPYVKVVLGVILGILAMIFLVYGLLLVLFVGKHPWRFYRGIRQAMLTAFLTRSSAATLPVSIKVAEQRLRVKNEIAGFSLPLGATINMDGVCVHLPMFALLAANFFGLEMGFGSLMLLVITTVLAAIGAGGVPGGSLMLLFIILDSMGLTASQTAVVVALALGVNPILDMFETMNNVTGDIMCTYVVAYREKLIEDPLPVE